VVTAAHKFDFILVMNETPNVWRRVVRSCSDRETRVVDRTYVFLPDNQPRVLRDATHAVQAKIILLINGHYLI